MAEPSEGRSQPAGGELIQRRLGARGEKQAPVVVAPHVDGICPAAGLDDSARVRDDLLATAHQQSSNSNGIAATARTVAVVVVVDVAVVVDVDVVAALATRSVNLTPTHNTTPPFDWYSMRVVLAWPSAASTCFSPAFACLAKAAHARPPAVLSSAAARGTPFRAWPRRRGRRHAHVSRRSCAGRDRAGRPIHLGSRQGTNQRSGRRESGRGRAWPRPMARQCVAKDPIPILSSPVAWTRCRTPRG